MISPIGSYLAEFRQFSASTAIPMPPPIAHEDGEDEPEPSDPIEGQIEAARRDGAAEAGHRARLAQDAALADLEARHAAQRDNDRARWVESESAVLAAALERGLTELETRIADSLADVLAPLLPEFATAKAVEGLREAIATLLSDDEHRAIEVSGPADLIGALSRACGDRPGIAFTTGAASEVTVRAGDTRIQTQLQRWGAAFGATRGDQP